MPLNFQTSDDVRREVLESFGSLDRPASTREIASHVWNRGAVDGTRETVQRAVNVEIRRLVSDGSIEPVRFRNNQHYFQLELLTRLALIRD